MEWAQGWLEEFDAKPDEGPLMFLKFAEHWMRQFEAVKSVKSAIENTRRR
jgi:hypothetical protein